MGIGIQIKAAAEEAVRRASDPVYNAQIEGRQQSGYSGGTAGGGLVHDYSNYNSGTNTSSGGGTKKLSSSSGNNTSTAAATEPSFDWGAYYAQLAAEAQAKADAAYQRNMERISSAYGSAASSLRGNLDSALSRLNAARDKSMGDVRSDAEKSLQEAYINNMLTRKNLNQRLSAMGYNGGATESTMARLENQYGNSRTGINETLNRNISDLDMTYGDNLAAAQQSYNSALANLDLQKMQLEMQAEAARQNAEASSMNAYMNIDSGYVNALKAALQNQAAYQYDPSQATNDFVAGQVQQAQPTSEGTNYARKIAQELLSTGAKSNDVSRYLQSMGYTTQSIADIFKQLGA